MLFAHMDQLGFVVRKIEADGLVRVERLGGVPERALASQAVLFCVGEGEDVRGRHRQQEPPRDDAGREIPGGPLSRALCRCRLRERRARCAPPASISARPSSTRRKVIELAGDRIAGTSVDDRAGCAVIVEAARALLEQRNRPTVHLVFSVQEEFNLRGAVTAAQALAPDIAIQLDLMLATDTPDMTARGDVGLGGGPAMSLYSFHGRGTLNGTIPHPALVALFDADGRRRSGSRCSEARISALLTDSSYVQLVGTGSLRSISASRPATPIPRSRSAISAISPC